MTDFIGEYPELVREDSMKKRTKGSGPYDAAGRGGPPRYPTKEKTIRNIEDTRPDYDPGILQGTDVHGRRYVRVDWAISPDEVLEVFRFEGGLYKHHYVEADRSPHFTIFHYIGEDNEEATM